jgi:hypothetical protein
MTMEPSNESLDPAALPAELKCDRELEVVLDEMVGSAPELPRDFAGRLIAERPFAPWEVRAARAWRVPALAAGLLFAASLGVFLAPLWSLGPGTALSVWSRVVAASLSGSLSALVAAGPLLSEAVSKLAAQSPELRAGSLVGLCAAAATLLGLGVAGRRRLGGPLGSRG